MKEHPANTEFGRHLAIPTVVWLNFIQEAGVLLPAQHTKAFTTPPIIRHQLFSAAYEDKASMEIDGDNATWTDGTDNHGVSIRITENWFWFEASF